MNNTNLHVYYHQRNLQGFKKYLDGQEQFDGSASGKNGNGHRNSSSSGPKSWSLHSLTTAPKKPDPNVKDGLGRTVLHLVCATVDDPRSHDYLSALLNHPHIALNVQDAESGWTALHRALWVGNLRAARKLLTRADIDIGLKDFEGFTAFDVYNSTCEGTNPAEDAVGTDLYTWGSNRNYSLGAGDTADRVLPERVALLNKVQAAAADKDNHHASQPAYNSSKFDRVGVNDVAMAKFHTGVLTAEDQGNLSLTGFGSNGRLGKTIHSQYSLLPQSDFLHIDTVALALGQDHTLAVTSGGYIMSWGQNRFSQLGYQIETPADTVHKAFSNSSEESQIQVQPKRIMGPLKKEFVIGVAASRLSSACWTEDSVWTWGTNSGHLGYDKSANPVQVLPRKVTGISQSVIGMAMTDYATACLIESKEVLVLHHDTVMKISFPTQRFPSDFSVYRPPQFVAKPSIDKITSCGNTIGAVSSLGDVFTFTLPNPVDIPDLKTFTIKPQMVWALRKRFTAVKDVALGPDSTIILCTHSGHVFVRQRQGKQVKVTRLPRLQRVVKVACNEIGSFAAIRSDAVPGRFEVTGPTLNEDMLNLLPHMRRTVQSRFGTVGKAYHSGDEEEEDSDMAIQEDIEIATRIAITDQSWHLVNESATLGTDLWLVVEERRVPVHKFILMHRVPSLISIIKSGRIPTRFQNYMRFEENERGESELHLSEMRFVTLLLLLQYVYSDDIAAIWDYRVLSKARLQVPGFQPDVPVIKKQLVIWANLLHLDTLVGPLASTGKVDVAPTLAQTWKAFYKDSQDVKNASGECDVLIRLEDRDLLVSSLLLRARCPTFDAMYEDAVWTDGRSNEDGKGHLVVDMSHLRYRSFSLVMRYLHEGLEQLIDYNHQDTLDGLLDFVMETIAVANFLLLDRLVLALSQVIQRHVCTTNAASLAAEATFHNAIELRNSIFLYIACNLETMLENGYLDDMNAQVLNDLAGFIQSRQGAKLPVSRSNIMLEMAMERQSDWLLEQDFPQPRLRAPRIWKPRSPRIYASTPTPARKNKTKSSAMDLLQVSTHSKAGDGEELFDMEDVTLPPAIDETRAIKQPKPVPAESLSKGSPWRSKGVETAKKTDLRSIMAEAEIKPSRPTTTPLKYRPPSARQSSSGTTSPFTAAQPGITPLQSASPIGARSDKVGTWRTTGSAAGASSSAFPTLGAFPPSSRPSPMHSASSTSNARPKQDATSSGPSRSEVIVPTRQTTLTRKSSEAAWATPVTYFEPTFPVASSSVSVSLLEIQKREQEVQAVKMELKQAPKSLREIQEQEKKDDAARVAEIEFQRWWAQEEARVAAEAARTQGGAGKKKGKNGAGQGTGSNKPKQKVKGEATIEGGQQSGRTHNRQPAGNNPANSTGGSASNQKRKKKTDQTITPVIPQD